MMFQFIMYISHDRTWHTTNFVVIKFGLIKIADQTAANQ